MPPPRPGPRSWLARRLRDAADAVERDLAPTTGGSPDGTPPDRPPARVRPGVPSAEAARDVPRRPGQPPEHWLRLVAAHAPGLLRGLDVDPDALPDAGSPAGARDPRGGPADGAGGNRPPARSGPSALPPGRPGTAVGWWPRNRDGGPGSWSRDADAAVGAWRGDPDGGPWPGTPDAAVTSGHADRDGTIGARPGDPVGTVGSWPSDPSAGVGSWAGAPDTGVGSWAGDPDTGVGSWAGDSGTGVGSWAADSGAGTRPGSATEGNWPDGVNGTVGPSSPAAGSFPAVPDPSGRPGATAPDSRPGPPPAHSWPGRPEHHRSRQPERRVRQPADDVDRSPGRGAGAHPGPAAWQIRPAIPGPGFGDLSHTGPGDGGAHPHRDALPLAGSGEPRVGRVDQSEQDPATASVEGTTADGRAGTATDPAHRRGTTGGDHVGALRFPAPWSLPTGARAGTDHPGPPAGPGAGRAPGAYPGDLARTAEYPGVAAPTGFDSASWSADRWPPARPGNGWPDAFAPTPAPDPWPVLPDGPAGGGAGGVPPTGATTTGPAGRWAGDPWPALPDDPVWRPATGDGDGERLRRLDHEQRGA
ncbi:hypothetical protein GA0074696_2936 [Micromonospora purpureochromogenes]|uniref:Uncharacterized protein n=1 Tax=Micromonospora purpureochromogenes TaxID=47872 RepID=A0A1C4XYP1_9ACTN|nr:hypothetical protein [Micromonospora purpureochromogenes]SCF13580.1 hypothetical protein GA0074696_2936 [Micromonospora purpureochromogenes]